MQLLERQKALNFDSLKTMAEKVEGSFVFTLLDRQDNLYVVKGDNPFCLYHYPKIGVYIYASTEQILFTALWQMDFKWKHPKRIEAHCGDILKIAPDGSITKGQFDTSGLFDRWPMRCHSPFTRRKHPSNDAYEEYLDGLKAAASVFGYAPESVDEILARGYTLEDVEEMIYCGEY